jgi:transposase, IS5 family
VAIILAPIFSFYLYLILMIRYTSQHQLRFENFTTPFEQNLLASNRWVILAGVTPWDELAKVYHRQMSVDQGRGAVDTRLIIGALIVKHMLKLDDREVIATLQENIYLQYFVGFSSFQTKIAFDPSLFVTLRNRMGLSEFDEWSLAVIAEIEALEAINLENEKNKTINKKGTKTNELNTETNELNTETNELNTETNELNTETNELNTETNELNTKTNELNTKTNELNTKTSEKEAPISLKDTLIIDTTAAEQKIKYPTDLGLLNDTRVFLESLIDCFYKVIVTQNKENSRQNKPIISLDKPRDYRRIARKDYLNVAMKRRKSAKEIRAANKKQLNYIQRNIQIINRLQEILIENNLLIPFAKSTYEKWETCQLIYTQQKEMIDKRINKCDNRIVSLHQPHVRAIPRGKPGKKIEFGSKVGLSVVNKTNRIFKLSWDAYNDGIDLIGQVEAYNKQYKKYPKLVLADKIYLTKKNRDYLKSHNIEHRGEALGKAKKIEYTHIQQLEANQRNHVEGQFGTSKDAYDLKKVKAKTQPTSESWVANIFFVMNVIRLLKVATSSMLMLLIAELSTFFCQRKTSIKNTMEQIFYTKKIKFA